MYEAVPARRRYRSGARDWRALSYSRGSYPPSAGHPTRPFMRRTYPVAVLVAAALGSVSLPCGSQVDTAARTSTGNPAPGPQSLGARPASLWVWVQSGPVSFHTDRLGGFAGARLLASGVRWHHTLHQS